MTFTELAMIAAIIAALFLIGALLNRPREDKPHPQAPAKKRQDEFASEWQTFHFDPDKTRAMPDWATLPGFPEFNVAGTSYRADACDRFFRNQSASARVSLEWDKDREPPGLMVFAHPKATAPGLHVGYIPAEVSEQIRETYTREMPIGARLRRAGFHRGEDRAFFAIVLVGPPKKRRDTFLIAPE